MNIKTYPLKFIDKDLEKIRKKASSMNLSINQFIMLAIKEKMEEK